METDASLLEEVQEIAAGDPMAPPPAAFLMVGIGASAGGIQALTQFFEQMSDNPGMAFVVIMHLSPEHDSNLAALLQRHTRMPVAQINESLEVHPNCVYVIPPAKHLAMTDGHIRLTEPEQFKGRRVPIDHFFRTLAETHGPGAVGIVLSGTGADGSSGLTRIKELGGVTMVQDPEEAEHAEMPRNAISTGMVDYVLPVAEMPQQLRSYRENAERIVLPVAEEPIEIAQIDHLSEILIFLRTRTSHNFAAYKQSTVLRRIERRMQVTNQPTLAEYLALLQTRPGEVQALLRDLLISVTNFFRDRAAWDALDKQVLTRLFAAKNALEPVRVWVAACATGEEAYALAMLLHEQVQRHNQIPNVQIFATDLDERAIAVAREGSYPETIALDVSPERLQRFFVHDGGSYRIRKEIRDSILFAVHDVLKDPPFSRLDLISCRNLLIYLNKEAQSQLLALFHFALKPDGSLFLGMSESTDGVSQLYSPLDKKHHIFARRAIPRGAKPIPSLLIARPDLRMGAAGAAPVPPGTISPNELHISLLEQYAPPSIVVNENYDVLHLSRRAGRYLQFVGGEPTYNLVRVIHPALRLDLRSALFTAIHKKKGNETGRIPVHLDGADRLVRIIVRPLEEPAALLGHALVIFDEIEETAEAEQNRLILEGMAPVARHLEEETQLLRDQLRGSIEQYETSVEELRASNEELQAMNEELRSASEELETGKEELQAVNEEMQAVNQELKIKVDELSRSNSDLQNLMISTDIGTVFLDRELRIKLYTPAAQRVFNIIPSDINRPLAHITHKLNYGQLVEDAEKVLRQLGATVHELQTSSGESYLVRLLPYRTVEHKIDGVVITLVDITERVRNASERRTLSHDLAEQQMQFEAVVQQMPVGLVIAEAPSGRFIYSNVGSPGQWGTLSSPFATVLSEAGPTYQAFYPDGTPVRPEEWPMTRAITRGEVVLNEEIRLVLENGEEAIMLISATPLRDSTGQTTAGVLTWSDVTRRTQMETALQEAHAQLEDRVTVRTAELAQVNEALQVEAVERQAADQARRELLRQLVSTQEEEQRHISRELHDQLGQSLTGLRFILDTMARRSAPAQRDQLEEATAIVDDMTNRISDLALDLRPPVLDDLGLIPALLILIERFTARTGVEVDLQHSGLDRRLSPATETVIFRVVQEALTNVARHAGVQAATVQILGNHDVTVSIEDHGRGFDLAAVRAAADTAGLAGMSERVTLIGGELTIESAPGAGTHVIAQLPQEQQATHE